MNEESNSIENYEEILTKTRQMAVAGSKPSDILRYLTLVRDVESKAQLMSVFSHGFNTELGKVTCIGGWWHDGSSELNDMQIDELLKSVVDNYIIN